MCYPKPKQAELEAYLKMKAKSAEKVAFSGPYNPDYAHKVFLDTFNLMLKTDPKLQLCLKEVADEIINNKDSLKSSFYNNHLKYPMIGVNTVVGGLSTYMVYKGGYYKWNEFWHKTKTVGVAFRWQSRWSQGRAPSYRAAQVNTVAKARNISNKLTKIGGVLIVADITLSGEIRPSHAINASMLAASTTGVGTIIAGVWFLADFGTMGVNLIVSGEAKGLGDIIDENLKDYKLDLKKGFDAAEEGMKHYERVTGRPFYWGPKY